MPPSNGEYRNRNAIAARKSEGKSAFSFRQVLIKNVNGTVSMENAVQTVGVYITPAGWTSPAITVDGANKSSAITLTGASSTDIRLSLDAIRN